MHDTRALTLVARGTGLTPTELSNARYLDALAAFRSRTGLCMTQGAAEGGSGGENGGQGGQQGSSEGSGEKGGQQSGSEGAGGKQDSGAQQNGQGGSDKGYPAGTPIAEMNDAQRAAYFEEKARTEENRRKDMTRLTGGRYGDELKKDMEELARLRQQNMSDSEKAIEEARTATRAEVALENVRSAFDLLLPDEMSEGDKEAKLEVLNLKAFLTSDGKVDTAKVKAHAATIAPAKGSTTDRDYGQGRRGSGSQKSGVSAGADLYAERHKKSTSSS